MAAMAHMFRAMGQEAPEVKHILEINPNHEIVKKLQSSTNDELIEDVSWILLDLAKIGILTGSLLSGIIGFVFLRSSSEK